MTTLAYKQYCNIPFSGGSYNASPIIGPISHRTPLQMHNHTMGVLYGRHPNPPQFSPADGASEFSNARYQYSRTASYPQATQTGTREFANTRPTSVFVAGTQRSYLLSQSTKYIAPTASSMYTSTRKAQSVGKSSYKQGLPDSAPLSYKNYNTNDVRSALQSVRGGGCVAPPKKGSIFNTSLQNNNRGVGWGSAVRSTY